MKRALLIAGGTVGGIGAVFSITPPQFGSSGVLGVSSASAVTSLPTANTSAASTSNSPAVTTSNSSNKAAAVKQTKKATPKVSAKATKSSTATATTGSTSVTSTPNSTSTTTNSSVTGSFTGDAINVGYGIVQVKITVAGGKITEATAVQSPTGRSQRFSDYALPNLRQQTLTVQSAAIQGVSGASYTSYGWYKSLISALNKAGLRTGV